MYVSLCFHLVKREQLTFDSPSRDGMELRLSRVFRLLLQNTAIPMQLKGKYIYPASTATHTPKCGRTSAGRWRGPLRE